MLNKKEEGVVNRWIEEKNYGFIHQNADGFTVVHFFHKRHLLNGTVPKDGQTVRFHSVKERSGLVAHNVEVIETAGGAL